MVAMSAGGWLVLVVMVVVLWGVATWALFRTLRDEDRKLDLLDEQGAIDTYSPESLRELRAWIEDNPDDPMVAEARERYNDCVETLRSIDEPFYEEWSEGEVEDLEPL